MVASRFSGSHTMSKNARMSPGPVCTDYAVRSRRVCRVGNEQSEDRAVCSETTRPAWEKSRLCVRMVVKGASAH